MEYSKSIKVKYNIHQKDKLLKFENFIKQKMDSSNLDCSVHVDCEHRRLKEISLDNVFKIKEIEENFDKISHIEMLIRDNDTNNRVYIHIFVYENLGSNEIDCWINSENEEFTLGVYEILNRFIEENFVQSSNSLSNNSTKDIVDSSMTVNIKKSLDKSLQSISLDMEDLSKIESLILQDLKDITEYKVLLTPTDKYLKSKQNVDEYHFSTIQQLCNDEKLLQNIDSYIMTISLYSDDVRIIIKLRNDLLFNSSLNVSGENQTMYFGKFLLLEQFLNSRRNWYFYIYTMAFASTYVLCFIFSISILLSYTLAKIFNEHIISWKSILMLIFAVLFNMLVPQILPKFKYNIQKENKWYQNQVFQFATMAVIGILTLFITIYK